MSIGVIALVFSEALILIGMVLYAIYLCYNIVFFQTAPYVPSKPAVVRDMLQLAQFSPGMRVLELGSGNGEICIRAAQAGAIVTGIEVNPFLIAVARWKAKRRGVTDRTHFQCANFWNVKFSTATNVVFVYLLPNTMKKLYPKLCAELRPGTVVISNSFQFPHLQPIETLGKAFKYVLPRPLDETKRFLYPCS